MNAEQQRLAENSAGRALASLGAVSGRARLGDGAGGLQRERRRLELFSARSRAVARLSLERGWHRRHLAISSSGSVSRSRFGTGAIRFLKERLFGVTGPQGTHGEDVKEVYFYTDCTPTHSYMRMLYRYPQRALSLRRTRGGESRPTEGGAGIRTVGHRRSARATATSISSLEYAKVDPDDIFISVTATNRGPEPADLHVLPTLWFRNTWTWGRDDRRCRRCGQAPISTARLSDHPGKPSRAR